MSSVTLVCKTPGFRRMGIAHPASETYPLERWTDEQLAAFVADPNFTVVVDRGDAAPIPHADWGSRVSGMQLDPVAVERFNACMEAFATRMEAAVESLRAEIERRFGGNIEVRNTISASAADFVTGSGPSATPNRGLQIAEAFISEPMTNIAAALQPADVAPGADVSDAVQDNGAGPAINDLGAKPAGVAEAAAIGTAEGIRPPVFDDARIQSIRVALKTFDPGADFAGAPGRPNRKKLREALGFEPTPEEIVAARVEAVEPDATLKT